MFIHLHKECKKKVFFFFFLKDYTEVILETFQFSNYHLINCRHCVMLAKKILLKFKRLVLDVV